MQHPASIKPVFVYISPSSAFRFILIWFYVAVKYETSYREIVDYCGYVYL